MYQLEHRRIRPLQNLESNAAVDSIVIPHFAVELFTMMMVDKPLLRSRASATLTCPWVMRGEWVLGLTGSEGGWSDDGTGVSDGAPIVQVVVLDDSWKSSSPQNLTIVECLEGQGLKLRVATTKNFGRWWRRVLLYCNCIRVLNIYWIGDRE